MIKAVLVLLFAFLAVVNCQGVWEGIWTSGGWNYSLCIEDGTMIHGRGSEVFMYGRLTSGTTAVGKYFFLGDKYTGSRASFANFYGGRGKAVFTYSPTADTITLDYVPKGSFGTMLTATFTRVSASVGATTDAERIYACAIIDPTSTLNVGGTWATDQTAHNYNQFCLSSMTSFTGSYVFNYAYDGESRYLPGYVKGYCAYNGQICSGVYTQNDTNYVGYSVFGAETAVRLSDDSMIVAHVRGAPGIHGFQNIKLAAQPFVRIANYTFENGCDTYKSSWFVPHKCKAMSLELCYDMDMWGLCTLSNTQGSCVRNTTYL